MFMRLFFNLIIVCFLQFLFMKGTTKYKRTQMVPSKPAEPSEISEAQRAFQVGKLTMLFSYVNIFTNLFAHVYTLNIFIPLLVTYRARQSASVIMSKCHCVVDAVRKKSESGHPGI